jgi:uncharacterized protein
MHPPAAYWIEKLSLQPHVEGGYYKRIYCSGLTISQSNLPLAFKGDRPLATAIYFLLEQHRFSSFHRIASDECWHFYYGNPLLIYEIDPQGLLTIHLLGQDFEAGERFQCTIKARSWFGAMVKPGGLYALVGCMVSPGFHFDDFELANSNDLLFKYPQHEDIIKKLTRQ